LSTRYCGNESKLNERSTKTLIETSIIIEVARS
jgi:hypothetical protein